VTELNPLAGAILQSIQSQRDAGIEKERQIRREQILSKNVAAQDDRFEHQVESADQLPEVNDEERQAQEKQKRAPRQNLPHDDDEGEPRIDVKA